VGEWGDSWVLLRHREQADVERGRFRLVADIGSRQWGGGSYDVDFDIGRFDADAGTHDGPISFKARPAGTAEQTDADTAKRLAARRGLLKTMRQARTPLTRTEIKERTTGATNGHIAAELAVMIDQGLLIVAGARKPEKGGREAHLYRLAPDLDEGGQ
jgi:hypothetical protein